MNIKLYCKNTDSNDTKELVFNSPWFNPTNISVHKDGVAYKGRAEDLIDWLIECQNTNDEIFYVITENTEPK